MMHAPSTKTFAWTSLFLIAALFAFAGCDDKELQQAKQEAAEAKAEISRLQLKLQQAEQDIQNRKIENNRLRERADTLNEKAGQLAQEKDKASKLADQAQQTATTMAAKAAKADNDADNIVLLKERVTQLTSLVAEQQAAIQQYQTLLQAVQQSMVQPGGAATSTEAVASPLTGPSGGGQQ
jgi:chromosome segregation ATPase